MNKTMQVPHFPVRNILFPPKNVLHANLIPRFCQGERPLGPVPEALEKVCRGDLLTC
jgi:hypothetical protein